MMGIRFTGCDSGGSEGVTGMAYTYYRALKEANLHRRFILTKGTALPEAPRARITYPDSGRKDKLSAARGDIPVLFLQSNLLKDNLNGRLDSIEPGKGMVRFPDWLSDNFYNELCAETRDAKGWSNLGQERNESWDLLYMTLGLCASELLRVEQLDWDNAPGWAAPWDKNDFVRAAETEARFTPKPFDASAFADFGKALA
jgi:phage terminase large subunit GpA-like protein